MKASALRGLVRPFTLLAPAVGVGSGAYAAAALEGPVAGTALGLGLASALLATSASNAWNQAFDVELDRVNKPDRPIPSGTATAREAIVLGHVCALLALVLGFLAGPWFFACVTVGVVATWIYSAPPLRTKKRPLGALLTIAIPRGALVPVAGWSLVAEPLRADPWALGAIAGLFVLGAAATKDFGDVRGDREHGCRTLPVLLGVGPAARVIAPFLVVPFLLYPLAGTLGLLAVDMPVLLVLAAALALLGTAAAWLLVRDPEDLAARGGNHPAWALMYLLLLGAHVGSAIAYQVGA